MGVISYLVFSVLLSLLPKVAAVEVELVTTEPTSRVSKTVVSDRMRLVFMLGLEGTGHHYIYGVRDAMYRDNPELPRIDFKLNGGLFGVQSTMSTSPMHFATSEGSARKELAELAIRVEGIPWPGILNVYDGSISYPSGIGRDKVFMYVDARRYAEAAEAENVDFRVLYLRRSAHQLVVANCVHRDFHKFVGDRGPTTMEQDFMYYMKILFTNAAVIHSLLGEIDPAFVVCHDWDLFGQAGQAKNISAFISPTEEVATLFEKSLVDSARAPHPVQEELPFDGADLMVARLQQKLDSFEYAYCKKH